MNKKRRKRSYVGVVLLSLFAAGGIIALSRYLASTVPAQSHERSAAAARSESVELWTEPEHFEAESESTAPEEGGETEAEQSFAYDELLAEEEGLKVYRIHGKDYRAILAVIDDARRLYVETLDGYGGYGLTLEQLMAKKGAILGCNGGGFEDLNGEGTGGTPTGIIMVDGEYRWGGRYGEYDCLALTADGRLITGRRTGEYLESQNTLYAICYGPALLVDGQIQEVYATQLEPRTAIGQRENGQILMLIIEGRQVGALGVDLVRLAEIMQELGAVNATNLDGGASSAIFYRGELLNRPNGRGGMRPMPSSLLLAPAKEGSVE